MGRHGRTDRRSRRMPRRAGFWLLAAVLLTFLAAASAPSPLYVIYQHRWGFSSLTLTTVFSVYAVALLAALLTVGGLSDHVGRRPVLAAALITQAAAMGLFLTAHDVGLLLVARTLQGLATGAATGALSAGLLDLQPARRSLLGPLVNSVAPAVGLAAGALGSGLLVQYAPAPTTLIFSLFAAAFVLLAAAVCFLPEAASRRPGAWASLRPRVAVPPQARRVFWAVAPCLIATWALSGLYLSLGPSLAAGVLHARNHLIGALMVTTLTGAAAAATLLTRSLSPHRATTAGSLVVAGGTGLALLALAGPWTGLFFAGTALAGAGFGSSFLGAFRALAALTGPQQRADLFAAVYIVSYLAFSVPAVLAGLAVPSFGLGTTATAYGATVVLAALLASVCAAAVRTSGAAAPAGGAAAPDLSGSQEAVLVGAGQ